MPSDGCASDSPGANGSGSGRSSGSGSYRRDGDSPSSPLVWPWHLTCKVYMIIC